MVTAPPIPSLRRVRAVITALALGALLLAAPSARAGPARGPWATVNVCDTERNPDTIGIRASMPGTGRARERMEMRFRVQFFVPSSGRWRTISRGADSGWVAVGSARFRARQAGHSFRLTPSGTEIRLRGEVNFRWRRDGRVVRRARRLTAAGHRSSAGADPAGYSVAECVIRV